MKKAKLLVSLLLFCVAFLLLSSAWSSAPSDKCPCVLEPGCGCCPEYIQGSTVWQLVGWECYGSGGECQYRHCLYA